MPRPRRKNATKRKAARAKSSASTIPNKAHTDKSNLVLTEALPLTKRKYDQISCNSGETQGSCSCDGDYEVNYSNEGVNEHKR